MERNKARFILPLALALLAAMPAVAADRMITNGIDPWVTVAGGKTFANFAIQPIPAGFFCAYSEAYTGRVNLRGLPLVTGEAGALGKADTIIQRLDDGVFNRRGVATTRIQVKALSLVSETPLRTACGAYNVYVTLNGEQPVTGMRIVRQDAKGGRFQAPVSVNAKITFQPIQVTRGKAGASLELTQNVTFAPDPNASWTFRPGPRNLTKAGFVLVDTDGDHVADTYLPGTSNFVAGRATNLAKADSDTVIYHAGHEVTTATIDQ